MWTQKTMYCTVHFEIECCWVKWKKSFDFLNYTYLQNQKLVDYVLTAQIWYADLIKYVFLAPVTSSNEYRETALL